MQAILPILKGIVSGSQLPFWPVVNSELTLNIDVFQAVII